MSLVYSKFFLEKHTSSWSFLGTLEVDENELIPLFE